MRTGSRLALFALALQLVLSFGHFHANAQAAPVDASIASMQSPGSDPAPAHQHPADDCVICAVMALTSTALAATPPILLLPQAAEFLYIVTDAEFLHLSDLDNAFQPRGPPLS